MTGCSAPATAPEGEDLYQSGKQQFTAMMTAMHTVLMSIHDGEWDVEVGGYGAAAGSCPGSNGSMDGFSFDYARGLALSDRDPEAVRDAAAAAFDDLGLEVTTNTFGSGDTAQWNVIAEGEPVGRAVVSITLGVDLIRATTRSPCTPGNWWDLSNMVFDDPDALASDRWRRTPATEGPDSVPVFFFPAESPLFWNEDATPVDPQPVITDPPTPTFGE